MITSSPGHLARLACLVVGFLGSCLATTSVKAWTPPPNDADYADANTNVFLDGEVTRVDVTIAPDDFQYLLDNPTLDDDKHATVRWRNSVIDETITDVGFRPRGGNYTRTATRKSWKLDFNDFVPGRAFHGLESVDLNGEHNDPTFIRRRMSHEILRQMGLPAPRTHFVALYINDAFWSIQVHCEHIDEEYADSWFGNKDGNLYKCLYQGARADLDKVNGEDYANVGGGSTYDETNNEPLSDYTDLKNFIRAINDGTSAQRLDQLESHINMDNFLRYLACDVALASWDDYWYGSNNYYLYRNTKTNRFEWVPYDYDNSLGMDYFGINWSTRNFDNWGNGGFGTSPAPLAQAVFEHTSWRKQYRRYLDQVSQLLVLPANQAKLTTWHNQLVPYFNGTIESGGVVGTASTSNQHNPYFSTGVTSPSSYSGDSFHSIGIIPYMNARRASLVTQLAGQTTPALPKVSINEVLAGNATTNQDEAGDFEDWIELYNDETTSVDVSGWYLTDDVLDPLKWSIPASTVIPAKGRLLVWCDNETTEGLLHAPYGLGLGGENLGLFMNAAEGRVLVDHVSYPQLTTDRSYGRTTDGGATFTIMCNPTPLAANDGTAPPCGGGGPRTPPALYINEFMASNAGIVGDELGDFDDWVEIYNDEDVTVDLGGLHLTDSLANPTKWAFPAGVSIPAKGFLVVWCDDEAVEGPLHAAFKLSAGGEEIGLYDDDLNNNQPIDTLTFGPQVSNVSQGRLPDGTGAVVTLPNISPGATNVSTPTATPTASPTATPSATASPSPSVSPTASPTDSPTPSATVSPTASLTPTASPTTSPTASATASPTASTTASPTASPTTSPTASATASPTPSATASPTASATVSPTASATVSPTVTATATATPTVSPTPAPLRGDIDQDGSVTAADLPLLEAHLKGEAALTGGPLWAADANEDGVVDAADLLVLLGLLVE